jgi:hypothetical protein
MPMLMFVLVLVRHENRTRRVTFGVLELNGAVMNIKCAKQLIDPLKDGIALRRRHVLDYHVTTQRVRL